MFVFKQHRFWKGIPRFARNGKVMNRAAYAALFCILGIASSASLHSAILANNGASYGW